jgi:predicted GIY-YIG superfamily endonuclease
MTLQAHSTAMAERHDLYTGHLQQIQKAFSQHRDTIGKMFVKTRNFSWVDILFFLFAAAMQIDIC